MANNPVGVAFIGCGSYNSQLAKAAAESKKLQPVACYDVQSESASAFIEKTGLQMEAYADLDEMLARDDIQGVIIASPNDAHRTNVEAAAQAGKHVFVDKPIANTISDALAIIDAAQRAGVALSVGHNGRRRPGHRKMKQMIEEGVIGTPVTVEANFSHAGGLGLTPQQWRYYRDKCPGLPLMQLGVHFADTVQYLLGDVVEVSSFMSHVAIPGDNDDATVNLLKFNSGLLGYLGSNYATPSIYYVNVYGTGGNLHCEGGDYLLYRNPDNTQKEQVIVEPVNDQIEELEEFADCITSGKKPEVDGRAGLMALGVVLAAIRSNELGRPVSIQELIDEAKS